MLLMPDLQQGPAAPGLARARKAAGRRRPPQHKPQKISVEIFFGKKP
jgi:hypothetical protein